MCLCWCSDLLVCCLFLLVSACGCVVCCVLWGWFSFVASYLFLWFIVSCVSLLVVIVVCWCWLLLGGVCGLLLFVVVVYSVLLFLVY